MPYRRTATGSETQAAVDAEYHQLLRERRQLAVQTIQDTLHNLMAYCPCCFAYSGHMVEKGHGYFEDCRRHISRREYLDGVGWSQMKRDIRLPNGHCFKCGVPNYGYNLLYHEVRIPKGMPCAFSDYVAIACWAVANDKKLKAQFCEEYGLDATMQEYEWIAWFNRQDDSLFYNGLEAFLWICRKWGLNVDF